MKVFTDRFRLGWKDVAILAVGTGLYAAIALATITKFSIWFDEAFSAYIIRFDFWQIAMYTAVDVQPPLYYWLLKLWSLLFGTSELALRSMSVFWGSVALIFGYLLIRRLFTRKAAVLGLGFMAVLPLFIRYSQEARMYTLVAAIVMIATYLLVKAMRTGRRRTWLWYGVFVALGMWTHYFTALIWLSHVVWHAIMVRQEKSPKGSFWRRFFAKEWLWAYGLATMLYLPWLPAFVVQAVTVQAGFWIPPVSAVTLPNFLTNILVYLDANETLAWIAIASFGVVVLIAWFARRVVQALKSEQKQYYVLLGCVAVVPISLLILLSLPPLKSVFVDRYLLAATLVLVIFSAVTIVYAQVSRFLRIVTVVAIGCLMLFGVWNVYSFGNFNKNSQMSNLTRDAVRLVKEKGVYGEPIIADSPWSFYEAVFYTSPAHPVYFVDADTKYIYGSLEMLKQNDDFKIKNLEEFLKAHPNVWYIGTDTAKSLHSSAPSLKVEQTDMLEDPVTKKSLYRVQRYSVY